MEPQKPSLLHRVWRVARIPLIVIAVLYAALLIYRFPAVLEQMKTKEVVDKIHAQKLTLKDVVGENLPPEPDPALKDATVEGVDANGNGIRDDVELAIFKEYPNSAKTRAVLLQYALALQMEVVQPIVNEGTVTAVAQDEGRAYYCVGEITPRTDMKKFIEIGDKLHEFVETRQLNTETRKKARRDFYTGHLTSYSSLRESCDLDLSALPN